MLFDHGLDYGDELTRKQQQQLRCPSEQRREVNLAARRLALSHVCWTQTITCFILFSGGWVIISLTPLEPPNPLLNVSTFPPQRVSSWNGVKLTTLPRMCCVLFYLGCRNNGATVATTGQATVTSRGTETSSINSTNLSHCRASNPIQSPLSVPLPYPFNHTQANACTRARSCRSRPENVI